MKNHYIMREYLDPFGDEYLYRIKCKNKQRILHINPEVIESGMLAECPECGENIKEIIEDCIKSYTILHNPTR